MSSAYKIKQSRMEYIREERKRERESEKGRRREYKKL